MRPVSRKHAALVVMVIVVIGAGSFCLYESNRTTFHFEEEYYGGRPARIFMYIRSLKDANVTISFVNNTSLMCRVDVELYDPQSGSVRFVREVGNQVNLEFTGRQRRVDIVLGTAVQYDLLIHLGENLNTTVWFGNGAVLNNTSLEAYQTGIIRIAVDENDGLTTHGSLSMGGGIPRLAEGPLHVLLDIDLPEGYGGRLTTYGAPISFVERVGWGFYGNGVFATAATVEHPRVTVGFSCTSIIARLID